MKAPEETNPAPTNVGGAWVVFIQAYMMSSPRGKDGKAPSGSGFVARRKLLSMFCELGNTRTAGLETGLKGATGPGALS